ncbi:hypothetical protein F4774DRAFT_386488 [Daldinia eschscholtzii]|nr:hypothetical protein F4774DRAFT_386488 [Daldinia eschscholtzii]
MATSLDGLQSRLQGAVGVSNVIHEHNNTVVGSGNPSHKTAANNDVLYNEKINERDLTLFTSSSQVALHADLAQEFTEPDESSALSDSCGSTYLDRNDCQSTLATQISEVPDDDDISPNKQVTGGEKAQENWLFDLRIGSKSLSGQDVPTQHGAGVETETCLIHLEKVDPKLSPDLSDSLRKIDAVLKEIPSPSREAGSVSYPCGTRDTSVTSIRLHLTSPYVSHRWKSRSEITFNMNRHSFSSNIEHLRMVIETLDAAAHKWNQGQIGVQFKRVKDDESAVFQVVYSPSGGDCLARSFLPYMGPIERQLVVYELAFTEVQGRYDLMTNLFCHELGHILGLRHEHAQVKEPCVPSVPWGGKNKSSVMNDDLPLEKMCIHDNDYAEVRAFYRAPAMYGKYIIMDVEAKPHSRESCHCSHCLCFQADFC